MKTNKIDIKSAPFKTAFKITLGIILAQVVILALALTTVVGSLFLLGWALS